MSFCMFSLETGCRLPELFYGYNKLTKVYDMLGFWRGTNNFYLAKHQSFHITLASFTPGEERLNPGFN